MRTPIAYVLLTGGWLLISFGNISADPPAQQPLTDFSKLNDGDLVFIESNSDRAPAIKPFESEHLAPITSASATPLTERGGQKSLSGLVRGAIELREISGAAVINNRLLVAADDSVDEDDAEKKFQMIALLGDAEKRLKQGGTIVPVKTDYIYRLLLEKLGSPNNAKLIADLEDATISPAGDLFLISSHSVSRSGKLPEKRKQFVKIRINPSSGAIESAIKNERPLFEPFPAALESVVQRQALPEQNNEVVPILNIEGMASDGGADVLLSLRSPLKDSKAVVLRLKEANKVFDTGATEPEATLTVESVLDLGGMGIRGMCRDETKGYWLIAGLSSDPDSTELQEAAEWSLWLWDGKSEITKRVSKSDLPKNMRLTNPEAICLIGSGDERSLLVISDDGKEDAQKKPIKTSNFIIIPVRALDEAAR